MKKNYIFNYDKTYDIAYFGVNTIHDTYGESIKPGITIFRKVANNQLTGIEIDGFSKIDFEKIINTIKNA